VILAALAYALSDGIDPEWRSRVTIAPHSWPGFGLALILVMGAYDGWQWVPQLAGELKNPARALPRALGGGVLIVVAVYLATNSSVLVLSPHDVTTSSLVTADVARHVLGAAGGALVAALMAVSTFGSNQSGMMTDPRVFFAMAQDGLFFRSVGAIHPRHRTPHVAVALIGVGGILYLYIRNFEERRHVDPGHLAVSCALGCRRHRSAAARSHSPAALPRAALSGHSAVLPRGLPGHLRQFVSRATALHDPEPRCARRRAAYLFAVALASETRSNPATRRSRGALTIKPQEILRGANFLFLAQSLRIPSSRS